MTKKKKGKLVQMLSPEKYIKTKSRSIPIHECWISSGWEESQIANIIISRKHKNGNITYGFYLVDLGCLGVKDASYRFNITETEYLNFIDRLLQDRAGLQRTDYKLVHNIIFAAVEFAEDFGFFPHKDFTSLMQFFLKEDTDEIELIEIECGNDGKPLYRQGPYENNAKAGKIIAQLEKAAGPGNYDYILNANEEFFDNDAEEIGEDNEEDNWEDEQWNDKETELKEKYSRFSETEKIFRIKDLLAKEQENENSEEEHAEIPYLVNSILSNHINYNRAEEIYNTLIEKLEDVEVVEELPDEFFAAVPDAKSNIEDFKKQFHEVYQMIYKYPAKAAKKIKNLRKAMPENPAVAYLEILLLNIQESDEFRDKLKMAYEKFPNFPLIKMFLDSAVTIKEKGMNAERIFLNGPEVYFFERKELHHIEVMNYLMTLMLIATSQKNMTLLEAMDFVIGEFPVSESSYNILGKMSFYGKLSFIFNLELERHER